MGTRLVLTSAATAVLMVGGVSAAAMAPKAGPAVKTGAEKARGNDCHATVNSLPSSDKHIYLYKAPNCGGAHDAKDDSTKDRDYGDGEGQIKDFDNQAGSLINHSNVTMEFYTRTAYSDKGDRFCVRPGHYVTKLKMYGDGKAEAGNWSNSISSHRKVDPDKCKRFFGWRIN
ncbi:hypothetical protein EV649_4969 [Kribbella sp. VKM Ac-2569]|uniref:hypothetical protein n=1 Tax=Kribbella sp. VKM Ac-2569 TaxID=2512220 RepID=UPI00102C7753|nr:hypothetical protein [Kribbella sp. VKM Ac-2569]RZT17429.1 hypothetical protein EV649_4969 [Kribbella sp. VKM Ac-2569]